MVRYSHKILLVTMVTLIFNYTVTLRKSKKTILQPNVIVDKLIADQIKHDSYL